MRNVALGIVACLMVVGLNLGQSNTLVLQGAKLYPISGVPIDRGVIVIKDGKITAVGPEGSVEIPPNSRVENLSGKTIIPGLVDSHSHIGIQSRPAVPANADGNESSGPVQPALRVPRTELPGMPSINKANCHL